MRQKVTFTHVMICELYTTNIQIVYFPDLNKNDLVLKS